MVTAGYIMLIALAVIVAGAIVLWRIISEDAHNLDPW